MVECPRCACPTVEQVTDVYCSNPNCGWWGKLVVATSGTAQTIPEPTEVAPARENNPEGKDLRDEAARWLAENPSVYALFERFALEAAAQRRPFGAKLLAERVRWECVVAGSPSDIYRLNNNHTAYVARKLVTDHPELAPLLRFRKTRY